MKSNLRQNKAITLIALVITIIVLLILAGVTITSLTGENGLLERAKNARDLTGERSITERVQLAYLGAFATGTGKVTRPLLENELNNAFGSGNYTLSEDLTKVTIDRKDYYFDGTVEGETQTVSDLRTASISDGVTALSDKGTTTIKDDKDNKIKVPKGFGIATDSGVNVEEGIVIEDADSSRSTFGSQFVWVPVGDINVSTTIDASGTINIPLARGTFNSSTGEFTAVQTASKTDYVTGIAVSSDFYEYDATNTTYANTKAKALGDFIKSAIDNGGYYIARYEAGVKGTTASDTATTYTISGTTFTKNSTTANSIVTTSGVGVWNYITQPNAATVCQSMYTDVNSDLVNSYAWDTAIVFIQSCGTNNNYANKKDGNGSLRATGNNNDKQCKINDMSGSVSEWTTETCSSTNTSCVLRGGYFKRSSTYAAVPFTSDRSCTVPSSAWFTDGFRPIIYL